ncbi:MAG TPA: ADP-ribosylglycohydrolase family protein [Feifaniaceae bacterium]|nr:ADP-ribosylglycohydrolase family protein [Feifaniaceae bacterium]
MVQGYLGKIYASLIGMNAGIRLGAPVEPDAWTYERIQRVFGEITDYVKEFKMFASDDDSAVPYHVGRTMFDIPADREMTSEDVSKSWLNYARDGIGLFWWGGYGVSTSHTAYLNLKAGIRPPQSGSMVQNGQVLAEQIGGQLSIDTFGLVYPNDPEKAARNARIAARVSHDGNALQGAGYIAACISKAFVTRDVHEIMAAGLSVTDPGSLYSQVVRAVMDYHAKNPENWRDCRAYLNDHWGYDKYAGACHVIPNAGVCAMAMLYSGGDFNRAIEIATMASWDTDSNSGSIGSILGAACGLEGIRANYRAPINDCVVLSGISGSLNILDLPTYAMQLARTGYLRAGETPPDNLRDPGRDLFFDFQLPGSTHGFRVSDSFYCSLSNAQGEGADGGGALEVFIDRMARGKICKIYHKPFYRRADFSDERYMPVFSPQAYPGQRVQFTLKADSWSGEGLFIQPYVRNTSTREDAAIGGQFLLGEDWTAFDFIIPDLNGAMVDEIGFIVEGDTPSTKGRDMGRLLMDHFRVSGPARYTIRMDKQKKEFASITPFSHNHGAWDIQGTMLQAMCLEHCEAMTGSFYTRNVRVCVPVTPAIGDSHLVSLRVQGAMRGYYAGLDGKGEISIFCNDFGMKRLATASYPWTAGESYILTFAAAGDSLTLDINGETVLQAEDGRYSHGMVGLAKYARGRTLFGTVTVEELD